MRAFLIGAALAAAVPVGAQPASSVPAAIASGAIGERFDGYMSFVTPPSPELRRRVNAINLKRRNLYIQLSSGRNVTADVIGLTTACQLFAQLPVGGAYMLQDGVWRRRAEGQATTLPDYCR